MISTAWFVGPALTRLRTPLFNPFRDILHRQQHAAERSRTRFAAAFLAMFDRSVADSFAARLAPPFLPPRLWWALSAAVGLSSTSPVAILATMIAAPITSPGRFSPLGPLGISGPAG